VGKILSIEAIAVDIPLTRNFGCSTYSVLKRSTVVTRLRTADGLVGQVYNGDGGSPCLLARDGTSSYSSLEGA